MKVDALKKLIKEAVREAIKEELGAMQSTPQVPMQETKQAPAQKQPAKVLFDSSNPFAAMLNQTAASMTNEDFDRTISFDSSQAAAFKPGTPAAIAAAPNTGVDISQLDFAKKAGAIFKASVEKDKTRYGI